MAKPAPEGITIEAGILARAMRDAGHIVMASVTIPVLGHVRLIADGETIEITTSDLDTEYRQTLPLRGKGKLSTTTDARRLKDIAGACEPGAQITLELAAGRLAVKSGHSRWTLPVLSVADFPTMPEPELSKPVTLPGRALGEIVRRTIWAISAEVTKPWYSGLSISAEDGKFCCAGSDGNVFIVIVGEAAVPADAPAIILAAKYAGTLQKLVADIDEPITLTWDDRKFRASWGETTLTGKLIDYEYVNWRRMLTQTEELCADVVPIHVDPASLRGALRRIELIGAEKSRAIKFTAAKDSIRLAMQSSTGDEASDEVPAECGEDFYSEYSARYLAPLLEHIGGDTIELRPAGSQPYAIARRKVFDGVTAIISSLKH